MRHVLSSLPPSSPSSIALRCPILQKGSHFTQGSTLYRMFFTLQKEPHFTKEFLHFTEQSCISSDSIYRCHPFHKRVFIECSSLYRMSLHYEETFSTLQKWNIAKKLQKFLPFLSKRPPFYIMFLQFSKGNILGSSLLARMAPTFLKCLHSAEDASIFLQSPYVHKTSPLQGRTRS